jgi:hypothetical protein
MKNSCEGIGDETTVLAFIGALNRGGLLRHTMTRKKDAGKLTLNGMIAYASAYTAADDDAGGPLQAIAVHNSILSQMNLSSKCWFLVISGPIYLTFRESENILPEKPKLGEVAPL